MTTEGSEREQAAKQEPWWKRLVWLWSALGFGTIIGLCSLFYNVGKDVGASAVKEQVEAVKAAGETQLAKCERAGAKVEEDLRQCSQSNASLQAVLRLSEADRTKILDSTVVVPSLRVTADGVPLTGQVPLAWSPMLNGTDGGITGRCFQTKLWLENTSSRDIRLDGIEALIEKSWWVDEWDTVEAETDPTKQRLWVSSEANLSPGARRYLPFRYCGEGKADRGDVAMTVFASGYLPLRLKWTAIPR